VDCRTILDRVTAEDPIRELGRWIEEAREGGIPQPASVAFVTSALATHPRPAR
jgi:hypothetical protein